MPRVVLGSGGIVKSVLPLRSLALLQPQCIEKIRQYTSKQIHT